MCWIKLKSCPLKPIQTGQQFNLGGVKQGGGKQFESRELKLPQAHPFCSSDPLFQSCFAPYFKAPPAEKAFSGVGIKIRVPLLPSCFQANPRMVEDLRIDFPCHVSEMEFRTEGFSFLFLPVCLCSSSWSWHSGITDKGKCYIFFESHFDVVLLLWFFVVN